MVSAPRISLRIWGTILVGLFLVFGLFQIAQAQEEGDVEAVLLDSAAEGALVEAEEATDLTPELIEFSQEHEDDARKVEESYEPSAESLGVEEIHDISIQMAVFGFLLLLLLMMLAFLFKGAYAKKFLFTSMALIIGVSSLFFIGSTIYINLISETKGPVHWHTDFIIYACGEELPPPVPKKTLSNKTGTPVLHQHEDKRVHVEGVLIDILDASFSSFVEVQGGKLTNKTFKVPTGEGFKEYTNGDLCSDGKPAEWNVFMYRTNVEEGTITKSKLDDYVNYVPAPYIEVPPGDCLIFEFGPRVSDTDKICNFYQLEINKGNLTPLWTQ